MRRDIRSIRAQARQRSIADIVSVKGKKQARERRSLIKHNRNPEPQLGYRRERAENAEIADGVDMYTSGEFPVQVQPKQMTGAELYHKLDSEIDIPPIAKGEVYDRIVIQGQDISDQIRDVVNGKVQWNDMLVSLDRMEEFQVGGRYSTQRALDAYFRALEGDYDSPETLLMRKLFIKSEDEVDRGVPVYNLNQVDEAILRDRFGGTMPNQTERVPLAKGLPAGYDSRQLQEDWPELVARAEEQVYRELVASK